MSRGRYDRKRVERRLREEMRWWNEECPNDLGGHVPDRDWFMSDGSLSGAGPAVCVNCGRAIERKVTLIQPKDPRFAIRAEISAWRTQVHVVQELP